MSKLTDDLKQQIRADVRESLDNVCDGGAYPEECAELTDEEQAEDLIDKTDVAALVDGDVGEDFAKHVALCVSEWRGEKRFKMNGTSEEEKSWPRQ